MSYHLRRKPLAREGHRIARQELEGVLKEVLNVDAEHRSNTVHEARKHLKKLRALIRLLRPAMGDTFYKRENSVLRDAAQRMSPIRDAHVRVQTIKKLITRSRTRRAQEALGRIHAAMAVRLDKVLAQSDKGEWSKQVATEIERALCRLDKWPLKRCKPKLVRDGLKAGCKKARRALAAARCESSDANLHDLRKSVKNLWYDLRLLGGSRPQPIKSLTKRMHDLGQKLGDDHDLAMLLAARDEDAPPTHADWVKLETVITPRRVRLQRAAFRLAEKLLAPKPGAFANFVVTQWETWRSDSR